MKGLMTNWEWLYKSDGSANYYFGDFFLLSLMGLVFSKSYIVIFEKAFHDVIKKMFPSMVVPSSNLRHPLMAIEVTEEILNLRMGD